MNELNGESKRKTKENVNKNLRKRILILMPRRLCRDGERGENTTKNREKEKNIFTMNGISWENKKANDCTTIEPTFKFKQSQLHGFRRGGKLVSVCVCVCVCEELANGEDKGKKTSYCFPHKN